MPILMDLVACTGSEQTLLDCDYDNDAGEDTHAEDAGVQCFPRSSKTWVLSTFDIECVNAFNYCSFR